MTTLEAIGYSGLVACFGLYSMIKAQEGRLAAKKREAMPPLVEPANDKSDSSGDELPKEKQEK